MTMMAYLCAAALIYGFTWTTRRGRPTWIDAVAAIGVPLCVSTAARALKVGTDYGGYSEHYALLLGAENGQLDTINNGWWDQGFLSFAAPFLHLRFGYDGFLFWCVLISLSVCAFVSVAMSRSSLPFMFCLFCLSFLFLPFVRQDMAASLALLGFYFIIKGKRITFGLSALAAISVHLTSLLVCVVVVLVVSASSIGKTKKRSVASVPLLALTIVIGIAAYVSSNPARIARQSSAYLAEGFIQGAVDESLSAIRNYTKFAIYVLLSAAMWKNVQLKAKLRRQQNAEADRSVSAVGCCSGIVVSLSVASLGLLQVSPVFARLSVYIFPFLSLQYALASRHGWHKGLHAIVVVILVAYLYTALAPVLEWM